MILETLKSSLIISCQAPSDSPLHHPEIISAIAQACVKRGQRVKELIAPVTS